MCCGKQSIALRGHCNKKKGDQAIISARSSASDGPAGNYAVGQGSRMSRELHCFARVLSPS